MSEPFAERTTAVAGRCATDSRRLAVCPAPGSAAWRLSSGAFCAPPAFPASALGAALLDGAAEGVLAALESATAEELDAAAVHLDGQLAGLIDAAAVALVDVLERRFAGTWPGARAVAEVHLLRQNPQFQANAVAAFLERTDHEEAFAYALDCLRSDAMIRELDEAFAAHWKRPRGKAERSKRAARIAEAAEAAGEVDYAATWRERAAG